MAELLKNLYNKKFVHALAIEINNSYADFNAKSFNKSIFDKTWPEKELKQRMRHIAINLQQHLPDNYRKALKILQPVSSKFDGIEHLIFPDFVELCGMDDYDASIGAMEHFTKCSSAEFPVRPFIIKYGKKMMQQMALWAESDNHHVRRLASEGCRPRLPWAIALPEFKKNPGPVLPILEKLKTDESEYVRRSVANNLNDISKDNPDIVIKLAQKWLGKNDDLNWIVKHGCRSLLKAGNRDILNLFGFRKPDDVLLKKFSLPKEVKMGRDITFSFSLNSCNESLGRLRIEYAVDFVRTNNKTSRKVFKISEGEYPVSKKEISKKHSFRKISTRKYYPGKHRLTIIVNGKDIVRRFFELI